MAIKLKKKDSEIFGTSFLDVISCGFGAVLAFVIIAKTGDHDPSIDTPLIASREIVSPANLCPLREDIVSLDETLLVLMEREAKLRSRLASTSLVAAAKKTRLQLATEESAVSISKETRSIDSIYAGGVPVGREYIIFLVDTSGSMQAYWTTVFSQISNILDAHPTVRGLQIMNDNGKYLMNGYGGRWIPDTPSARKRAMEKLATWSSFSNSSPAEGLDKALRVYARKGDAVSIYVIGDDFTGASYQHVIDVVDRWNIDSETGERLAIIHGIGFPWGLGDRFSTLMREVANQNGGVFVGI